MLGEVPVYLKSGNILRMGQNGQGQQPDGRQSVLVHES